MIRFIKYVGQWTLFGVCAVALLLTGVVLGVGQMVADRRPRVAKDSQ